MHPMVARAFCMIALSPSGRAKLRDYERSVMAAFSGRYFTAFELTRCMQNPPKNPDDQAISRMENLWNEYDRDAQRRWEFNQAHDIPGVDRLSEIYAWEDHAINNYLNWIAIPYSASPAVDAMVTSGRQRSRADLE